MMLSKNPRVAFVSSEEGQKLCEHYQLPAPSKVEPVSKTWMHVNFALYFPPDSGIGNLMLRRVVWEPGWDTLHREFTALMVARQNPALPIVDRYQILPDGLISGRASLSRLLPGQSLNHRKGQPEFLRLCEQMGSYMAELAGQKMPYFGTSPNGNVFLPTASSWKGEWRSWMQLWAHRARQSGELAGARERLITMVEDRIDALDEVEQFCLVHGDLHSGNVLVDGQGDAAQITGIIDWDQALAGDHLVDWSISLNAPPEALHHLVKGYGTDRVRAFLQPNALARLEVYYFTHLLVRIGMLSSDLLRVDEGQIHAIGLSITTAHIENALKPDAVKRRLEDALSGTSQRIDPQTTPGELLFRRILSRLMSGPPVRADQVSDILLAISAGLMSTQSNEKMSDKYSQLGHQVVDTMGQQSIRFHHTNCVTPATLKTRVFDHVMQRPEPGLSMSICLLSGCFEVAKKIAGETHPGVWSGLSTLVESLVFVESNSAPLQGMGRLVHALLGFDAAISIGAPSGVIARYAAILSEFEGIDSSPIQDAQNYLNQGPPPGIPKGQKGKALMPLVMAMARLEAQGRLKIPASAILKQTGYLE